MKKLFALMLACGTLVSCSSTKKADSDVKIYGEISTSNENKKEPVTLTFAVAVKPSDEEMQVIEKFNEADNGYVVAVKDYSEYYDSENSEWWQISEENQKSFNIAVTQDIAGGKIDIIRDKYLGGSVNTMDIFANKGFLLDLYQFMNEDEEVNSSTLNSHILQIHETDGKLYTLPTIYSVNTLIGESRYVGEKENWSVDEMISYWNKMPEGSKINGYREKDYVYMTILRGNLHSFIDYKNAEVSFDSPQFRKALEFCNTFDTPLNYYNEQDESAVNFVQQAGFSNFASFHDILYNFKNEPVTFVGYPSEDNSGSYIDSSGNRYAVCASVSEEKKQGAWEFIKMFGMEEYQNNCCVQTEEINIDGMKKTAYYAGDGFPVNLNVYNEIAENTIKGEYVSIFADMGDENIGLLTHDESDRLTSFINSIQSLETEMDRDLWTIIEDEIMGYFSNEKDIDTTISNIQNRAAIMVSEKN